MTWLRTLVVAASLLGLLGVGSAPASAAEWGDTGGLRISARVLYDGRIEFALQQREASGWGGRVLPQRRFFPADATPGRWLASSPITLDASTGDTEFRITARRLADGRTEAALQARTGEVWGERRPASGWFFPSDARVERWYSSGIIPDETGTAALYRGSVVDGRLLGAADAPIRIVAYEDFACSFCRTFGREIIPILEEEYIRSGTVSLEYRHMAILGSYSRATAAASECAADQDLFWPYHDILIANPSAPVKEMAREMNATLGGVGLDLTAFDACVDEGTHADGVQTATAEARSLLTEMEARVIGVPTFLINGELWRVGIPSIDELRAEIARVQAVSAGN